MNVDKQMGKGVRETLSIHDTDDWDTRLVRDGAEFMFTKKTIRSRRNFQY
jgi:hypothetical protein